MALDCSSSLINVSSPGCNIKYGVITGLIVVPVATEIATEAAAMLEATYTTLINLIEGSRGYVINFPTSYLNTVLPTQEDPVTEDTPIAGVRVFTGDGAKRLNINYSNLPKCTIKALRSLNNQNWEVFLITSENYILAYSEAGTIFRGFSGVFHAGNELPGENNTTSRKYPIMFDFKKPGQWDDNGIWAKPTAFELEDLDGIKNVTITEVSASTSAIVVDIKTACGATGVTGMVTGDMYLVLDSSGGQVATTSTESTTVAGRYSLAGTFSEAAHTFKTKDQPDATTKGYETPTSLAITPS